MIAARVAPAVVADAEAALTAAAARGDAVAFEGGGTERDFGYSLERADLLLETTALDRIVEYSPADLVVEVEAGMTLEALQRVLRPNRQRLALDPPLGSRATIGGLLATNAYGPRRTRYGTLRDLIVGISIIRADGVRVRGGGKVVKNVAGFDLPKILVGSLGSLGMIATATLRLHPAPEATRLMRIEVDPDGALRAVARELVERRLEPAAVAAYPHRDGTAVFAAFEGFEAGAAEQADRFAALARDLGCACREEDAAALARHDEAARTNGDLRARISVPPSALDAIQAEALRSLAGALERPAQAIYPTIGVAFVGGDANDRERAAAAVETARAQAEALGGNLVVTSAPPELQVDRYGTLPPSFGLMRELKMRFDPERRLNRGRFIGRL